jgi:hypothetical protein
VDREPWTVDFPSVNAFGTIRRVEATGVPCAARAPLLRAWYGASIAEFLTQAPDTIAGSLLKNSDFDIVLSQRDAWMAQIPILQNCLKGLQGSVYLEYNIPRMGRRVDAVLVIGPAVFVVEFKVGEHDFEPASQEQVWDYALDLKNFHEASHALSLVPILVATESRQLEPLHLKAAEDGVFQPVCVGTVGLRAVLDSALKSVAGDPVDADKWARASYRLTPTIIEAARALYAQHSVEAIARSDAEDLSITSRRVEEIIDEARQERRKVICFVTGVPGAGKTLVGLNVATQRREEAQPTHAVFLSGNGPLVAVLREALTRDEVSRRKQRGERVTKGEVGESVKAFIQNVHHFRDEALRDPNPPDEHVAIFDEAQRAWDHKKTSEPSSRSRALNSIGPASHGTATSASPVPAGRIMISAETAGATSTTRRTVSISATPTACSSPAPGREWSSLSRKAIRVTPPGCPRSMTQPSII